jgi:hypothetical protein
MSEQICRSHSLRSPGGGFCGTELKPKDQRRTGHDHGSDGYNRYQDEIDHVRISSRVDLGLDYSFVASTRMRDLLFRAKHLFVAAKIVWTAGSASGVAPMTTSTQIPLAPAHMVARLSYGRGRKARRQQAPSMASGIGPSWRIGPGHRGYRSRGQ